MLIFQVYYFQKNNFWEKKTKLIICYVNQFDNDVILLLFRLNNLSRRIRTNKSCKDEIRTDFHDDGLPPNKLQIQLI